MPSQNRKLLALLPFALFVVLAIFLWRGLSMDPKLLPSALLDRPVPTMQLATLGKQDGVFSSDDLKGKVSLVNFWATWCVSCQAEHEVLMDIANSKQVAIYGVDYKDKKVPAKQWLNKLGNPYAKTGFDSQGKMGIEWGVYGTPETFVVDSQGIIRYRHVGPITQEAWQQQILPVVKKLKAKVL